MVDKILADTSVLIGLQKGEKSIIKRFDKHKDEVVISRITACEFIYGAQNKKEKEINKEVMERLNVLEINEPISKHTFSLLDKYSLGMKLGIADALIASSAIVYNLHLWTLNTRHFKKIKELKLFKPLLL